MDRPITVSNNRVKDLLDLELLQSGENSVYSPISITYALFLTYFGSDNQTLEQLQEFLGTNSESDYLDELIKLMSQTKKNGFLKIANGIFVDRNSTLKSEYLNTVSEIGDVLNPDFSKPDQALKQINEWVSYRTDGMIPQLLDQIAPLQKIVLVNAVHFKAAWGSSFEIDDTKEAPFYGKTKEDTVMMMYNHEEKYYYEDDMYQMIELPYEGSKFGMGFILPKVIEPLPEADEPLPEADEPLPEADEPLPEADEPLPKDNSIPLTPDTQTIEKMIMSFKPEDVKYYIPRFTLRTKLDLTHVFQKLGLNHLFEAPDFSKISDDELFINQIVHEAVIKVDEEGTEASAATGMGFSLFGGFENESKTYTFRADRPFSFYIRYRTGNVILFSGEKVDP